MCKGTKTGIIHTQVSADNMNKQFDNQEYFCIDTILETLKSREGVEFVLSIREIIHNPNEYIKQYALDNNLRISINYNEEVNDYVLKRSEVCKLTNEPYPTNFYPKYLKGVINKSDKIKNLGYYSTGASTKQIQYAETVKTTHSHCNVVNVGTKLCCYLMFCFNPDFYQWIQKTKSIQHLYIPNKIALMIEDEYLTRKTGNLKINRPIGQFVINRWILADYIL